MTENVLYRCKDCIEKSKLNNQLIFWPKTFDEPNNKNGAGKSTSKENFAWGTHIKSSVCMLVLIQEHVHVTYRLAAARMRFALPCGCRKQPHTTETLMSKQ